MIAADAYAYLWLMTARQAGIWRQHDDFRYYRRALLFLTYLATHRRGFAGYGLQDYYLDLLMALYCQLMQDILRGISTFASSDAR